MIDYRRVLILFSVIGVYLLFAAPRAVTAPATQSTYAPDSVVEGVMLYAARMAIDRFADLGYRSPSDTTGVNWGSQQSAAPACQISVNLMSNLEQGRTAYIPSKIRNCYGNHLGEIINDRDLLLWASVIRSWADGR